MKEGEFHQVKGKKEEEPIVQAAKESPSKDRNNEREEGEISSKKRHREEERGSRERSQHRDKDKVRAIFSYGHVKIILMDGAGIK